MGFVGNLRGFPAVKEFWKSVKNWQSYCHEFCVQFFLAHPVYSHSADGATDLSLTNSPVPGYCQYCQKLNPITCNFTDQKLISGLLITYLLTYLLTCLAAADASSEWRQQRKNLISIVSGDVIGGNSCSCKSAASGLTACASINRRRPQVLTTLCGMQSNICPLFCTILFYSILF